MACSTMDLSITFSRATASAICKSSSRFALTTGSAIFHSPVFGNFRCLFSPFAAVTKRLRRQSGAGRFNQFVGERELRLADIGKGNADQQGFFPAFWVLNEKPHLAFSHAFKIALEALPAR